MCNFKITALIIFNGSLNTLHFFYSPGICLSKAQDQVFLKLCQVRLFTNLNHQVKVVKAANGWRIRPIENLTRKLIQPSFHGPPVLHI